MPVGWNFVSLPKMSTALLNQIGAGTHQRAGAELARDAECLSVASNAVPAVPHASQSPFTIRCEPMYIEHCICCSFLIVSNIELKCPIQSPDFGHQGAVTVAGEEPRSQATVLDQPGHATCKTARRLWRDVQSGRSDYHHFLGVIPLQPLRASALPIAAAVLRRSAGCQEERGHACSTE
jgi:hypothetical protein